MDAEKTRLDKWLWAARFFKTRSLASDAIDGGKVELNGERAKRAKGVKPGDDVRIKLGAYEHRVTVLALSDRRGPASEAQKLYEELAESRLARERLAEQHRIAPGFAYEERGRPTKKDRRDLEDLREKKRR
ncbi:MAG: RNA-binding protein [Gemmatimonadetes bacterium]|nr:RNA-binding protein [Gemmatimonadota bacterium]